MSVSSINYGTSVLGQSVQNLNNQLTTLSTRLSTGVKSQTYAGMGVNEGFAIAARAQLSNITAFGDTMTNVNTIISAANTALQTLSTIGGQIQSAAAGTPASLDNTGQTVAQENAASELSSMVGILRLPGGSLVRPSIQRFDCARLTRGQVPGTSLKNCRSSRRMNCARRLSAKFSRPSGSAFSRSR